MVSNMLEQGGFTVTRESLPPTAFNQKIVLSHLEQPRAHQPWDIALTSYHDHGDLMGPFFLYHRFALDGTADWVVEEPELRRLFYAVNKAVEFVPYLTTLLKLDETTVTEQHWSVRQSAKKE
jgi:hypothetical protein